MSGVGGRNTAKRKIQVRKFVEERFNAAREYSNPFMSEEEESECLRPRELKLSFKRDYTPDDSEESDSEDQILSKRVNLDEADRFIASLKMPKARTKGLATTPAPPVSLYLDIDMSKLEMEAERVRKLRLRESQGDEGEEEEESDKIQDD